MKDFSNIRKGTQVYSEDGQLLGTVEDVQGNEVFLGGQRYQPQHFSRFENNRLYLGSQQAGYNQGYQQTGYAQGSQQTGYAQGQNEYAVPVVEEQLKVGKQQVQAGEVQLNKRVIEEQQSVPVELRREEVNVQQRDIQDRRLNPDEAGQAFQEGTIRVPLRAEEAVVNKEAYVTGEVVLNKDVQTEQRSVSDTVRKEQVVVDKNVQQNARTNTVRGNETDTEYTDDQNYGRA